MKGRSKAWLGGLLLTLLMCGGLLSRLNRHPHLLVDSDTQLILQGIDQRHDPLSWFVSDWPLANHFYRPVSSLLFEYDHAAHKDDDYKWGMTNAVLSCLCTLGLFWFLRELTDSPLLTILSTFLFYLWQTDQGGLAATCALDASYLALLGGLIVHRQKVWLYLPAFLTWYWVAHELVGIMPLESRMLVWIPGRTASSMTVFAFIALAAYARYERLAPKRPSKIELTAMDRPATKSTVLTVPKLASPAWPILAVVAELIALGAYEQAVMIPACLGLVAISWYVRGSQVRWWWGVPFGLALLAYIGVRHTYIPAGHSFYYNEQKRTSHSAVMFLQRYFFFPYFPLNNLISSTRESWILLFFSLSPTLFLIDSASALTAFWQARRRWLLCGFGWLSSTLSYAPMAWFKDFEHYHYWPMAMRTIGVVALGWVAVDLTVIAWSRQAVQAPKRLSPAPGSLLHP